MTEHGTNGNGHVRDEHLDVGIEYEPDVAVAAIVTDDAPTQRIPQPPGLGGLLRSAADWSELRHTPYGLQPAVILGAIFFIGVFETQAFSLALPDIARDLRFTIGIIIGVVATVNFFSIFSSLLIGYFADRTSRVKWLAGGTIAEGAMAMLTSATGSSATVGLVRSLDEASTATADVPTFSLLADYYPPETRGRMFSAVGSISRVGRLAAPLAVGLMLRYWGWRPTFVVCGVPLVLVGLVAAFRLREPVRGYFERKSAGVDDSVANEEDEAQSFGEAWRTVWGVRTLRRLFIADIFNYLGDLPFGLFFILFLAQKYNLDALQRGYVLTPAIAAGLLGTFLGGGLVDTLIRRNPGRVLTLFGAFSAITAVGFAGLAFKPPLGVLVALFAFSSFFASLIGPALRSVYAQVIPPSVRTQGLQVIRLAEIPGNLIGFALVAGLVQHHGYTTGLLACCPMFVIGGLIQLTAGKFFAFDMRNATAAAVAAEEYRRAKREGRGKLLVCRDVDVEYDGVQVLFSVDFDVDEGDIIALLGTNGAGKSTLLRAICGTQEASAGAIVFDGRDITHMPSHEIAGRGVVMMPGGRGVFPGLTVRENLLLGGWRTEDENETRRALAEVFEIFPILKTRGAEPATALSGGEQQMLSLAQAFLSKPRLLMIDELSLGLSPGVVGQLIEVVKDIHRRGVTVIIVEQSVNVALTIAERAIFMEKGEIKFQGATADLLRRPDILRAVYVKGTGAMTSGSGTTLRTDRERHAQTLEGARNVLEVEDIVKRYGGVTAVDGISFALRERESLGIIGPNGSGKTTLFDIISGYQTADNGVVRLDGVDITPLSAEERARRKLIRRFQDARLFPSLTVFETILIALDQRLEVKSGALHAVQLPNARRAERRLRIAAERLIELLDLGAFRDKFVKELSTGLRRIVDLACVLAAEPEVLLLDEPSSGIAQAEAEALAPLLRRVRYETGCALLIIEHDMPLISAVSDELLALELGRVIMRGAPESVLNDDRVIESYLGTSEATVKRSGVLT